MTAPSVVARVIDALGPLRGRRVLEVGTGTGYQAALLATLGADVVSAEVSRHCVLTARYRLRMLGVERLRVVHSSGFAPELRPGEFDQIVVNCVLSAPPAVFIEAIPGWRGVLVAPFLSADGSQRLLRLERNPEERHRLSDLGPCRFSGGFKVPAGWGGHTVLNPPL